MIINGELQTGLGGGVCQVSTTVFNAAYEAGLDITERTNHALYISHYPQGRDATVNYPDLDLKFVNDTGRWLLLRTFVGSSVADRESLRRARRTGASSPRSRRSRSSASPPTTWREDPTITKGRRVVDRRGVVAARDERPPEGLRRRTAPCSTRTTWYSSYRGEKKIVLVGTKPKPEPEPSRSRRKTRRRRRPRPRRQTAPTETSLRRRSSHGPGTSASAAATASASHAGKRAGRNVFASTTAWRVQPSATSSSPLVIAYS